MRSAIAFALTFLLFVSPVAAQQMPLPNGAESGGAAAMQTLAKNALAIYREPDRATFLDTRFRLQLVAGQYREAAQTLEQLRALEAASPSLQMRVRDAQYALFARAKTIEADSHTSFAAAFAQAFYQIVEPMDDRTSALVVRALNVQETGGLSLIVDMSALRGALKGALAKQKGKTSITLSDALALLRAYQIEETYRTIAPFVQHLVAEDDDRRYIVQSEVPVKTPDGAIVCTLIVRPRSGPARLPTLMEFSVYADLPASMSEVRRSASNGYVGVAGFSRGKLCSPGPIWPYEHDGADAAALIDWIARQPWSDGRVGMFGASYDGFTQWAAAKHRPKALKAMMPAVSSSPGADGADGRQHRAVVLLLLAVLYRDEQDAEWRCLRRSRIESCLLRLVYRRQSLSRPGQDRRQAQSRLGSLDEPSVLRCLLAKPHSLRERIRTDRHSRPDDDRLLRRRTDRRALLPGAALQIRAQRRALSRRRSLRSCRRQSRHGECIRRQCGRAGRLYAGSRGPYRSGRASLSMVRLYFQTRGEARHPERPHQLRSDGRKSLEARAVAGRDGDGQTTSLFRRFEWRLSPFYDVFRQTDGPDGELCRSQRRRPHGARRRCARQGPRHLGRARIHQRSRSKRDRGQRPVRRPSSISSPTRRISISPFSSTSGRRRGSISSFPGIRPARAS